MDRACGLCRIGELTPKLPDKGAKRCNQAVAHNDLWSRSKLVQSGPVSEPDVGPEWRELHVRFPVFVRSNRVSKW